MAGLIHRSRVREDDAYKHEIRLRAQTELFFLAHEILHYDDITEWTHRQVADFFVKKDPRKSIAEQDKIKSRLLMMPRGTFKTTFNIADSVQWIADFPNIGMLALTASNSDESPLADAFVAEVTGHFHRDADSEPTLFQDLFPEHNHLGRLKSGKFTTPARDRWRREPSLMGASIETSLSGWHFDVIKLEDIQDNRNSQTTYGLRKVKQNLFINLKMLMPWGYRDATGTRYGPADVYGYMMERLNPAVSKVLWKPAMVPKPHARQKEKDDPDSMNEGDWELFFPELLPYEFLMEKKAEDLASYMTQYMNIATGAFVPMFDHEKLLMLSLEEEMLPLAGPVYIVWRFEMEEHPYCTGMAGMVDDGRLYVVDTIRGSYRPSTLAQKVVGMAKLHGAHQIEIEETPGAHHHETAIRNAAINAGWSLAIRWLPYDEDPNVRQMRIKSCEPLVKENWVWFSKALPHGKELIRQLHHYGMLEDSDFPDLLSRLCAKLPATVLLGDRDEVDDLEFELQKQRDLHDRVYGLGVYAPQEPEEEEQPYAPVFDKGGLDEIMPGLSG
jgi:hypothetical protein